MINFPNLSAEQRKALFLDVTMEANEKQKNSSTAMTDTEIVEALATKVMGWKKGYEDDGRLYWATGVTAMPDTWNPLTDWNHWREVEEKIMENYLLFSKYTALLAWRPQHDVELEPKEHLVLSPAQMMVSAPLRTRCESALLAKRSLQSHDS